MFSGLAIGIAFFLLICNSLPWLHAKVSAWKQNRASKPLHGLTRKGNLLGNQYIEYPGNLAYPAGRTRAYKSIPVDRVLKVGGKLRAFAARLGKDKMTLIYFDGIGDETAGPAFTELISGPQLMGDNRTVYFTYTDNEKGTISIGIINSDVTRFAYGPYENVTAIKLANGVLNGTAFITESNARTHLFTADNRGMIAEGPAGEKIDAKSFQEGPRGGAVYVLHKDGDAELIKISDTLDSHSSVPNSKGVFKTRWSTDGHIGAIGKDGDEYKALLDGRIVAASNVRFNDLRFNSANELEIEIDRNGRATWMTGKEFDFYLRAHDESLKQISQEDNVHTDATSSLNALKAAARKGKGFMPLLPLLIGLGLAANYSALKTAKNTFGVMTGIPRQGSSVSRSTSKEIMTEALPAQAHSKKILSLASRQSDIDSVTRTSMPTSLNSISISATTTDESLKTGRDNTVSNSHNIRGENKGINSLFFNASTRSEHKGLPKLARIKTLVSITAMSLAGKMKLFSGLFDDLRDTAVLEFFSGDMLADLRHHRVKALRDVFGSQPTGQNKPLLGAQASYGLLDLMKSQINLRHLSLPFKSITQKIYSCKAILLPSDPAPVSGLLLALGALAAAALQIAKKIDPAALPKLISASQDNWLIRRTTSADRIAPIAYRTDPKTASEFNKDRRQLSKESVSWRGFKGPTFDLTDNHHESNNGAFAAYRAYDAGGMQSMITIIDGIHHQGPKHNHARGPYFSQDNRLLYVGVDGFTDTLFINGEAILSSAMDITDIIPLADGRIRVTLVDSRAEAITRTEITLERVDRHTDATRLKAISTETPTASPLTIVSSIKSAARKGKGFMPLLPLLIGLGLGALNSGDTIRNSDSELRMVSP
ncbi:MAG: hypothetical protein AABZ44_02625, partial [Elusimicrobiota bacterium]